MRIRTWIIWGLALALAVFAAGCAKKEPAATTADSTAFSTNPTEQTTGSLTPEGQVPPPEPAPEPTPAEPKAQPRKPSAYKPAPKPEAPAVPPGITVPSETAVTITLSAPISSETAKVGDAWTGVVKNNVVVGEKTVIPSGSTVSGTVTAVTPAVKGGRALLDLAIGGMTVEGANYTAHATTEAIEAGSTRARNLGAIAGGTGAGALVGAAIGGKKGALIGGLIGGAGAGTAVAKSKGYQVVLKEGTELTFKTTQPVTVRR